MRPSVADSHELARWACDLDLAMVPAPARLYAESLLIDAVGCALAGWGSDEVPAVLATAEHLGEGSTCTVLGSNRRASLLGATLLNSYLTTAITACDVYAPSHCHITPLVVPAALATAESIGASGAELLRATVAGLEVTAMLLAAMDYPVFRKRGWHSPGVVGPIGSAVASGLLLGLDADQLHTAMSLGFSQAAGTFAAWPTPTVKFHQARGAYAGVVSAHLALRGFKAAPDPLWAADGGLFVAYGPATPPMSHFRADTRDPDRWELENVSLRMWPGATPLQVLLTALLATPLPAAADVRGVTVQVSRPLWDAHHGLHHPTGAFESLLSYHFATAVALVHGDLRPEHAIDPAQRNDPRVRHVQELVRLIADPELNGAAVRVELETATHTVRRDQDHALGSPAIPAERDQVTEKFRRYAAGRLDPLASECLLAGLSDLTAVASLGPLIAETVATS